MKQDKPKLLIEQEIHRWGPMPFHRFMDLALYHPIYGYYNRKEPLRGRQGDYFTSMQVGDLMALVFADVFAKIKKSMELEQFTIIELGSGDGTFLEALLEKASQSKEGIKGWRVIAIEAGRTARERIEKKLSRFPRCTVVSSIDDLNGAENYEGVIFSNEFFDALPFHRCKHTPEGWKEITVHMENGQLAEKLVPLSDQLKYEIDQMGIPSWGENQEIEMRPEITPLMRKISQKLNRGYMLTIDYGYPRENLYSARRKNGTWLCYHQHTANTDGFSHIGRQDITAHVDFTQLAEPISSEDLSAAHFCSQGVFLSHFGAPFFDSWLKDTSEAVSVKRRSGLQQLLHPEAMGEKFWILTHVKNTEILSEYNSISNRIRRLTVPPLSIPATEY